MPKLTLLLLTGTLATNLYGFGVAEHVHRDGLLRLLESLPVKHKSVFDFGGSPEFRVDYQVFISGLKEKTITNLKLETVRPTSIFKLEIVSADVGADPFLFTFASVKTGSESTLVAFRFGELPDFPDRIVDDYYPVLPAFEFEPSLIAATKAALDSFIEQRDWSQFLDYERSLVEAAANVPSFVRATKKGSENANLIAKANATANMLKLSGQAQYVSSKKLTERIFCSVYMIESSMGPTIFSVCYLLCEDKPVVLSVNFEVGLDAIIRVIPDLPSSGQ
jgi:hypothetical protein